MEAHAMMTTVVVMGLSIADRLGLRCGWAVYALILGVIADLALVGFAFLQVFPTEVGYPPSTR